MYWDYKNVPPHQSRGLLQVISGLAEASTFIRNLKGPNTVHLSVDRDMGDHESNMKQFFLDTVDGVSVTFTYLDTQKFSLPRP